MTESSESIPGRASTASGSSNKSVGRRSASGAKRAGYVIELKTPTLSVRAVVQTAAIGADLLERLAASIAAGEPISGWNGASSGNGTATARRGRPRSSASDTHRLL